VPRIEDPVKRQRAIYRAREEFYFYTRWMFLERKGFLWQRADHHEIVCAALMRVFRGECRRLIINIPPRYSKTELMRRFIEWSLGKVPDAEFIYTCYSGTLATESSVNIRNTVLDLPYRELFPDVLLETEGQDHWKTTRGGVIYAAGFDGTITGFGAGKMREGFAGALVVDDAHKPNEIRSDVKRKGVITTFQETVENRLNSRDTPIIVMGQRLGEEDLPGWLLAGGNGERWESIVLPALREDGTALWPAKHTVEDLRLMERASPYKFAGQYQQRPSPAEGNIFRPDAMPVFDAVPFGTRFCRGWDLGASGEDGAATAGLKLGLMPDRRYIIADVRRIFGKPDEVESGVLHAAQADGRGCEQSLPQDPGQAGKVQVRAYAKLLAGYKFHSSPESGDKVTRAEPFAAQVNVGNVVMLRAAWNDPLVSEMRHFPNGKYKDQVDAGSRAFARLSSKGRIAFGTA